MSAPEITAVLPTLAPGPDLRRLLAALRLQMPPEQLEILVLDSGSPRGSLASAGAYAARRVDVPPAQFGHGRTRNLGIQLAQGSFIAFFTQDALPQPGCLAALLKALKAHPDADAAYARQLPRPDADPSVAKRLAFDFPAGEEPTVQRLGSQSWQELAPRARLSLARYDHVAAMARRGALLQRPLPEVPFGEDLAWAIETLKSTRALLYVPTATVVHSHRRGPLETFRRARLDHALLASTLALRTVPSAPHLLAAVGPLLFNAARRLGSGDKPADVGGETARLAAELLGQLVGGRSGRSN